MRHKKHETTHHKLTKMPSNKGYMGSCVYVFVVYAYIRIYNTTLHTTKMLKLINPTVRYEKL